jgi:hypothetical protein
MMDFCAGLAASVSRRVQGANAGPSNEPLRWQSIWERPASSRLHKTCQASAVVGLIFVSKENGQNRLPQCAR